MQRAEVAERVAKAMRRWGYQVGGVAPATLEYDRKARTFRVLSGPPIGGRNVRAIRLHVLGRHEQLAGFISALKGQLHDVHPGISIRYHEADEFMGSERMHGRMMRLKGSGHREAESIAEENVVKRVSVLVFSNSPLSNDVYHEAERRVKQIFGLK